MGRVSFEKDWLKIIKNPLPSDFKKLKVFFDEDDNPLYLAQFVGITDENVYQTFVYFEKSGVSFCWYEHEDPYGLTYFTDLKEIVDEKEFFESLEVIVSVCDKSFLKNAKTVFRYAELANELPNKSVGKKMKI